MRTIMIKAPTWTECDISEWEAGYSVTGSDDVKLVQIKARSAIEVVVAKVSLDTVLGQGTFYYISSPNFGVAIPAISSLLETHWITEKLIHANMPRPDAVTVAQVLLDLEELMLDEEG